MVENTCEMRNVSACAKAATLAAQSTTTAQNGGEMYSRLTSFRTIERCFITR
jgi:hypothetical protein